MPITSEITPETTVRELRTILWAHGPGNEEATELYRHLRFTALQDVPAAPHDIDHARRLIALRANQ